MKIKYTLIIFIMIFCSKLSYADTATASQSIRIIIPKLALIDVDNTTTPLQINFDPIADAGDNFKQVTASSYYDVTSNISGLMLYAKTNKHLKKDYNLTLKVHEAYSRYVALSPTAKRVSTQGRQAQINQELKFKLSPTFADKTIPYGNIDVVITYTLVEP